MVCLGDLDLKRLGGRGRGGWGLSETFKVPSRRRVGEVGGGRGGGVVKAITVKMELIFESDHSSNTQHNHATYISSLNVLSFTAVFGLSDS